MSIVIAISALIQVSGEVKDHNIDLQWSLFWQQVETSISIIVVSITGFRTLLGMRASKKRQQSEKRKDRLQSYRQRLLRKALRRNPVNRSVLVKNALPDIPNATLTGMRSFINGDGTEKGTAVDSTIDTHNDTINESEPSWTSIEVRGTLDWNYVLLIRYSYRLPAATQEASPQVAMYDPGRESIP